MFVTIDNLFADIYCIESWDLEVRNNGTELYSLVDVFETVIRIFLTIGRTNLDEFPTKSYLSVNSIKYENKWEQARWRGLRQ